MASRIDWAETLEKETTTLQAMNAFLAQNRKTLGTGELSSTPKASRVGRAPAEAGTVVQCRAAWEGVFRGCGEGGLGGVESGLKLSLRRRRRTPGRPVPWKASPTGIAGVMAALQAVRWAPRATV